MRYNLFALSWQDYLSKEALYAAVAQITGMLTRLLPTAGWGGSSGRAGRPAAPAPGPQPWSMLMELPDAIWYNQIFPLLDSRDLSVLREACSYLRRTISQRQEWLKLNAGSCSYYAQRPQLLGCFEAARALWLRDRPGSPFPDDVLVHFGRAGLPALASACERLSVLRLGFQDSVPYGFVAALAASGSKLQELQLPFRLHADAYTPASLRAQMGLAGLTGGDAGQQLLHTEAARLLAAGLPQLGHLALSNCVMFNHAALEAICQGMSFLTHLGLSDCRSVYDEGIQLLGSLPSLRSLLLHTSTEINGTGWAVLEALTALSSLNLCANGPLDGPAWERLAAGTALAAVTCLSPVGPHAWNALARLPQLANMQVHEVRLRDMPEEDLAPLQEAPFPSLTRLVLYDTYRRTCATSLQAMFAPSAAAAAGGGQGQGGGHAARGPHPAMPLLQSLEVWYNIDEDLLAVVAERLPHLRSLALLADNTNRSEREGLATLEEEPLTTCLVGLTALEQLNISLHGTPVEMTHDTLCAVAERCPELRSLSLGPARLMDAFGLSGLCGQPGPAALTVVRLSDCPALDNDVLRGWADSLLARRLRELGLTRCPAVTDAGLAVIAPTLEQLTACELKVLGEGVTDAGVLALLARPPRIKALTVCACPGTTAERCTAELKWRAHSRGVHLYWSATLT